MTNSNQLAVAYLWKSAYFRPVLFFLAILSIFSSCKKEKSVELGGLPAGSSDWAFKESNIEFKGTMDTAFYLTSGNFKSLIIEGTSVDGQGDIILQIFGNNIVPGTYKNPYVNFQYYTNNTPFYESDPQATDRFTITITSIDSNTVTGTFSGEVVDVLGVTKTLTEGRFSARFRQTSSPPPAGNGQVVFWAKAGCAGGSSVQVKIQGQTGNITSFVTTAPACGASGQASFTLPSGTYSYTAACTSDTVQGTITVIANSCTSAEVIFSLGAVNCRIIDMAFYDDLDSPSGAITSFLNASNQITKIQIYDSVDNVVENSFNLSYTATQVRIDGDQYFDLEPGGRIKEFHGFLDPSDKTTPKVVIKYTYNAEGYMTKSTIALDVAPNNPVLTIDMVWTAGNLTKVTIRDVASGERTETDYQYNVTKPAKTFMSFLPNNEIFIFQSAINYGKNSTNIVTRSTTRDYDAANNVVYAESTEYTNYTFDTNNYVRSLVSSTDGSFDAKFVLSYKCF